MEIWNKNNPDKEGDYICRMQNAYIKLCFWDGDRWFDMWSDSIDGIVKEWIEIPYDQNLNNMEKKQTAVQQLEEYLTISIGKDRMRMLLNEFQKAKEMEKEQIVNAHGIKEKKSSGISNYVYKFTGEEYYNETYKSE